MTTGSPFGAIRCDVPVEDEAQAPGVRRLMDAAQERPAAAHSVATFNGHGTPQYAPWSRPHTRRVTKTTCARPTRSGTPTWPARQARPTRSRPSMRHLRPAFPARAWHSGQRHLWRSDLRLAWSCDRSRRRQARRAPQASVGDRSSMAGACSRSSGCNRAASRSRCDRGCHGLASLPLVRAGDNFRRDTQLQCVTRGAKYPLLLRAELVRRGEGARRRAAAHADLAVDVFDVPLDRANRQHQPLGDLLVAQSVREQPQDLDLRADSSR